MYSNFYSNRCYDYDFKNELLFNEEIITLNQAIDLIKKSIKDEKEDELFYETLISQASSEKEKDIIRSIRDDEKKHNYILRYLYNGITGQRLPQLELVNQLEINVNYKDNLEKALFGEIGAVKKYRKIMGIMPSGKSYNLLMSIMTDELTHADKYNYLISINTK